MLQPLNLLGAIALSHGSSASPKGKKGSPKKRIETHVHWTNGANLLEKQTTHPVPDLGDLSYVDIFLGSY